MSAAHHLRAAAYIFSFCPSPDGRRSTSAGNNLDGKTARGGGDSSPVGSPRGATFASTGSVVGSQKAGSGAGGVFASSLPDDAPENWLSDFEGRLDASNLVRHDSRKSLFLNHLQCCDYYE